MINEIFNGDSASEIRTKLNELITIANHYSSSQWPDMGGGGDPAPGDDGSNYQISLYTSNFAPPIMPDMDSSTACNAISTGYSVSVYLQKDPMNMSGTQVPEVNDYIYEGYPYSSTLGMGYYGWTDAIQNKSIELSASGQIMSITDCV